MPETTIKFDRLPHEALIKITTFVNTDTFCPYLIAISKNKYLKKNHYSEIIQKKLEQLEQSIIQTTKSINKTLDLLNALRVDNSLKTIRELYPKFMGILFPRIIRFSEETENQCRDKIKELANDAQLYYTLKQKKQQVTPRRVEIKKLATHAQRYRTSKRKPKQITPKIARSLQAVLAKNLSVVDHKEKLNKPRDHHGTWVGALFFDFFMLTANIAYICILYNRLYNGMTGDISMSFSKAPALSRDKNSILYPVSSGKVLFSMICIKTAIMKITQTISDYRHDHKKLPSLHTEHSDNIARLQEAEKNLKL